MKIEAGTKLGEYEILEPIGSGGMGSVWLARHIHMGKKYAVKVLPESLAADKNFVARFRDEARVMAELRHPRIVQVQYMGIHEGCYFLAMDYVTGPSGRPESLRDRLRDQPEGRIGEDQTLAWAIQIAEALSYAHGRGVVHRDIKPGNIVIDSNGDVLLTDFGLAKAVGNEFILSQIHESMSQSLGDQATRPGGKPNTMGDTLDIAATIPADSPSGGGSGSGGRSSGSSGILGTYDYMAPEQRGEGTGQIDQRTDVYAFGVLLYRMLTGQRPVAMAEPPSQIVPELLHEWDIIVSRCLKRIPDDRYPSAEALLEGLRAVGEDIRLRRAEAERRAEEERSRQADERRRETEERQRRDEVERQRRRTEARRRRAEPKVVGGALEAATAAFGDKSTVAALQAKRRHTAVVAAGIGMLMLCAIGIYLAVNSDTDPRVTQRRAAESLGVPVNETLDLGGGATMKLVLIPSGKFQMGSPKTEAGREADEGPQREVTISKPFYMGVHEITQSQWKVVMGTEPWAGQTWAKSNGSHAASYMSWDDATKFCETLSKKTGQKVTLPTEAQWEYACRAGSKTAYCFGDDASELGDYAWYDKNAYDKDEKYAHAAGQKKPNAFGLYDMHGNVWEWCRDWYDAKFYANAKNVDPENTTEASARVLRGGSWYVSPRGCRAANRNWYTSGGRSSSFGYRVVVVSGSGVD